MTYLSLPSQGPPSDAWGAGTLDARTLRPSRSDLTIWRLHTQPGCSRDGQLLSSGHYSRASLGAQMVKNPPSNAGDSGSIPGWGRSLGGGNGNSLQYSGLENTMDREAWQATVHRIAQSRTQRKQLSMHARSLIT